MPFARIRRLSVSNFRSYHAAQIEVAAGPVVLVGPNGSGKTNLIEAISFLAPGRGLRRAVLGDVAFSEGDGSWAVAADVEGALGLATLGTGIEPPTSEDAAVTRKCRIDREPVASATAFADHLRVVCSRHDVGTASGREGYDHVHGSVRLGLRLRGAWEGREHSSTCCKLQKPAAWKVHCCLPSRGGVGGIGILAPLCVECGLL